MTMTAELPGQVPWWKEPTKDQWMAWIAAWLGWTLDAFDFTIFLLIMVPIAETFHVPLIEVTAVFTVTLWLRLVGAVGSGWLANSARTHLSINKDAPSPRTVHAVGRILPTPFLGGLHHLYVRI
jgi:MFS family permease